MDPRLLTYYNRELQFIRESGGEFAKEYPKIAGRLGLETYECADPYVERLLESFAFLAARVQLKIDDEFPRFTQHLLDMVYPHYLAPTPSMAVVHLQPSLSEGSLIDGFTVPKGSELRSQMGRDQQTACEYRTAQDLTLWPLTVAKASYSSFLGDLGELPVAGRKPARAAARITLEAGAGITVDKLALDALTFFIRGDLETTSRLYEQIIGNTVAVVVRPAGERGAAATALGPESVRAVGFEDEQALLPYGNRSFHGYRLLHEYFAFPERLLFFEIEGLREAVRRCSSEQVEILILTGQPDAVLDNEVNASHFELACVPVVNLFPRTADRIHLSDKQHEYHVVPDRTRPMDFEVHSVQRVRGYGVGPEARREFFPFYETTDETAGYDQPAYYTVHREKRRLSEHQRLAGPRSSYVGSETFLSLVDGNEGPFRSDLKQLGVEALCTNRDLPLHMPIGRGASDFTLQAGAPVDAIRCVAGPTAPRASHAHGTAAWRLISHLSLNHLSITDTGESGAAALRELLGLYADLSDEPTRRQINGVRSTSSRGIARRLPVDGPVTFGRGVEVRLSCDESAFQGAAVFLLGSVLERFFAKHASINAFTETVLETVQRGEVMRWPARTGLRPLS